MRGGVRPSASRSVISPRLFGRQTLKMKVNPGQRRRPALNPSVEKLWHWYWMSGTGSEGSDFANSVASVAPTESCPDPLNSHSSASFTGLVGLLTALFNVSVALVLNMKLDCYWSC